MTARYNAKTNTFRELPGMEKPENPAEILGKGADIYFFHASQRLREYNDHVAALRTIPCHESCKGVFKHDCDYEEGRDYKVYQYEDRLTLAYPVQKDGEDEALIHYEYAGKLAYCLGITINGRDWEEKALPELKKHYTITPR